MSGKRTNYFPQITKRVDQITFVIIVASMQHVQLQTYWKNTEEVIYKITLVGFVVPLHLKMLWLTLVSTFFLKITFDIEL